MVDRADKTESYMVKMLDISKRYPNGVLANDRVNFRLRAGEVHALLGENGAGKSTLVKILYGMEHPDKGEIFVKGELVELKNSAAAITHGIGMVHQELMLIPYMTVAENVMLGREITALGGRLNRKAANLSIMALAQQYGFEIDPAMPVHKLPIGVQQRVEILKLLYRRADILILDEPTALLTPQESTDLFRVIRSLVSQGKSVIFITHKLDEVYEVADRMTVVRAGKVVGTTTPVETNKSRLTEMMVGKTVEIQVKEPRKITPEPVLEVRNLRIMGYGSVPALEDVTFELRRGEILGVAGIEGNGQTQLAEAIIGLRKVAGGVIALNGRPITNRSVRAVRRQRVASIPDDRQKLGLILPFKISENLALNVFTEKPYASSPLFQRWDVIRTRAEAVRKNFDVRAASVNLPVSTLSGGNQQKVVVGRELSGELDVLVASQPTRGVDVASANYIHQKLQQAADNGTAVLLISSDLDELLALSDRIMTLLRGKNVGIVDGPTARKEQLGAMMLGLTEETVSEQCGKTGNK